MNNSDFWTYDRVERLISLWNQPAGPSMQDIAHAMGTTRNAVAGKLFRSGLNNRKAKQLESADVA